MSSYAPAGGAAWDPTPGYGYTPSPPVGTPNFATGTGYGPYGLGSASGPFMYGGNSPYINNVAAPAESYGFARSYGTPTYAYTPYQSTAGYATTGYPVTGYPPAGYQ